MWTAIAASVIKLAELLVKLFVDKTDRNNSKEMVDRAQERQETVESDRAATEVKDVIDEKDPKKKSDALEKLRQDASEF